MRRLGWQEKQAGPRPFVWNPEETSGLVEFLTEAKNADFTLATVPGVDHSMWVCTKTSGPGQPCAEMEFSPAVLDLLKNWIYKH